MQRSSPGRSSRSRTQKSRTDQMRAMTVEFVRLPNEEVYAVADGRARYVPTVEILDAVADTTVRDAADGEPASWSYGPSVAMPLDLPRTAEQMRVWMCRSFRGEGLEYGARSRPTPIPLDCRVSYADNHPAEQQSRVLRASDLAHPVRVDVVDDFSALATVTDGS